jgi:hypothetical protein
MKTFARQTKRGEKWESRFNRVIFIVRSSDNDLVHDNVENHAQLQQPKDGSEPNVFYTDISNSRVSQKVLEARERPVFAHGT